MTPEQALSQVKYQVYETSSASTGFFSDAEIYGYFWQGECELNNLLHCYEASYATTTTANVNIKTWPSNFESIELVRWKHRKLQNVDQRTLDLLDNPDVGGSYTTGDPTHYYTWADSLYLWPTPTTAATLTVWGYARPSQINASSTAFSIPAMFTDYLTDYALWRCYAKDQDDGRASFHRDMWMSHKAESQRIWSRRKYADRILQVKSEENYPSTNIGIK